MEYKEIKGEDLIIGQVYTDIKPDSKYFKPMQLKLIEVDYFTLKFKNLSDNTQGYKINKDGLIHFSRHTFTGFFKIII